MNHNHADYRPQEHIAAKGFRRTGGNQNGQECESGIGKHMEDLISIRCRHSREQGAETFQQSHQQTGGNNCRNDRHENVAQRFDCLFERVHFLSCRRLDLFLGCGLYAGNGYKFVIHPVYNTGSENNLELSLGNEYAFDTLDLFDLFFFDVFLVLYDQTQTGRTVCAGDQIFLSADLLQHLYRSFMIIHTIISFELAFPFGRFLK